MWKWDIAVFIAGYVVSCWSWPWCRTKLQGLENEVLDARQRVKNLEAKIKAKL